MGESLESSADERVCSDCGDPVDPEVHYVRGDELVCKWCYSENVVETQKARTADVAYDNPTYSSGAQYASHDGGDMRFVWNIIGFILVVMVLGLRHCS